MGVFDDRLSSAEMAVQLIGSRLKLASSGGFAMKASRIKLSDNEFLLCSHYEPID